MARKAAGKYDGVMHKLTRLASTEAPAFQDKVEQAKIVMREALKLAEVERPAVTLAKQYRELRAQLAEIKAQQSAINIQVEACTQLLLDSQEQLQEGWGEYGAAQNMMRLVTGDTLRTHAEPFTVTEDKDVLRDYFMSSELKRLLAPPWATVNSLNKDRLLNGDPEIPGTKLYLKPSIVFTAFKPDTIDETTERVASESDL